MEKYINDEGKKIAVIGSRTCTDKSFVTSRLDKNKARIKMVISGGAEGPDTFAVEWAQENGIPYLVFPAKWHKENGEVDRGAGFRRNRHIVKNADVVMAFYDGVSRGTAHSMEITNQVGKDLRIIRFDPATMPQPVKRKRKGILKVVAENEEDAPPVLVKEEEPAPIHNLEEIKDTL